MEKETFESYRLRTSWVDIPNSSWTTIIEEVKRFNLEAWCEEFSLDQLPNLQIRNDSNRKWNWITHHLAKYFANNNHQHQSFWKYYAYKNNDNGSTSSQFAGWLNSQSLTRQYALYWPYMKCLDRSIHFKSHCLLTNVNRVQVDNYERPNHYLKHYLKSNPYTCLLYKQFKEHKLSFREHMNPKLENETAINNYQSLLSTLIVSLIRITFLEFEKLILTCIIIHLEYDHQSMHLFYRNHKHDTEERKMDYNHLDWNLIQSMISLILDCRSLNPLMQLEQICKHQQKLDDENYRSDSNIIALEFDLEHYQCSVWNSNKTLIKWYWIDWHFKNVQWNMSLLKE